MDRAFISHPSSLLSQPLPAACPSTSGPWNGHLRPLAAPSCSRRPQEPPRPRRPRPHRPPRLLNAARRHTLAIRTFRLECSIFSRSSSSHPFVFELWHSLINQRVVLPRPRKSPVLLVLVPLSVSSPPSVFMIKKVDSGCSQEGAGSARDGRPIVNEEEIIAVGKENVCFFQPP